MFMSRAATIIIAKALVFICSLRHMKRWRSYNAIGPAYIHLVKKGVTWAFVDFFLHTAPALVADLVMNIVNLLKCKCKCTNYAMQGKAKAIDGQINVLE